MTTNVQERPNDVGKSLLGFYYHVTFFLAASLLGLHTLTGLLLRPADGLNVVVLGLESAIALVAVFGKENDRRRGSHGREPRGWVFAAIGILQVGLCVATRGVSSPFFVLVVVTGAFVGLTMRGVRTIYVSSAIASAYVLGTRLFPDRTKYGIDAETFTALTVNVGFLLLATVLAARMARRHRATMTTLQTQSRHDPLTSLENRRAFMERMGGELERADRFNWPITMLLLDLDHFKLLNDEYGHAVGDIVLVETASILREQCGSLDHLARVGGEEFAIAAVASEPQHGRDLADRIVRAFRTRNWERIRTGMKVTASIGVARIQAGRRKISGNTLSTLLDRSDQALYHVKQNGRDNYEVAAGEPVESVVL